MTPLLAPSCCWISTIPGGDRPAPRSLLEPEGAEGEGYVPNVVYSCGGMINGSDLVLPYGLSDAAVGIAIISLPELLTALRQPTVV